MTGSHRYPKALFFINIEEYNCIMKSLPIVIAKDELAQICQAHHIQKFSLFGSVLRSDFRPESDIDVLVEFEPNHTPGYLGMVRLQRELSSFFGNRKVDLRTPRELSKYFRQEVVAGAAVQYAAA